MAGDTLGDCPICGHKEEGYEDWESLGYLNRRSAMNSVLSLPIRVWRCKTCFGLLTTDPIKERP